MKKIYSSIAIVGASVLCMACSRVLEKEAECQSSIAPVIHASQEVPVKSSLSVDGEGVGTIYWGPKDEISVFYGATSGIRYTSDNIEPAISADFTTKSTLTPSQAASNNIWGLYPYNSSATCDGSSIATTLPAIQYGVADTFADDLFITAAHSDDINLHFYNVCGGIKFSLSRNDITSITFKGNNNEDIAGDINITFVEGSPRASVTNGIKSITLFPQTGGVFTQNTYYYIVLLPTLMSNGFTMTFETDTQIGTFNYTAKPVEIKRATFGRKNSINSYASFSALSIPDGPVDLGLSVLWASKNLGASQATDYGDYYAWGETGVYYQDGYARENPQAHWLSDKTSGYAWNSYSLCNGDYHYLTKYCTDEDYGNSGMVDYKTVLELCDDAAHRWLGGKWRMPTQGECRALINNCLIREVTFNGVPGYKIKSKVTGYTNNWIFLPKSGYREGTNLRFVGEGGRYWSSSLYDYTTYDAYVFSISNIYESSRYYGFSIRPVYDNSIDDSTVTDLSASGTANCYIVSTSGKYKFKAVKGNTNNSVGTVSQVSVLWESFGTDVAPTAGDIIKQDVSYSNGYVYFNIDGYHKGNAVIAAQNSYGDILWSWHIWCTDQPNSQRYYANYSYVGTMMDRNLGATSSTPGDVKSLGLLYQWGRKDPFLSGRTITSGLQAASTLSWPTKVNSTSSVGTIDYAIKHPTTFIKGCDSTLDWYYSTGSTQTSRWGQDKTQYDPCPAGWQVPKGGANGIWANAFGTSNNWTNSSDWDATYRGMDFGKTSRTLGWYSNGTETIWYPAASARWHDGGNLSNPGQTGYYWSYTDASDGAAYYFYFDIDGKVYPACRGTYGVRGSSLSVRCQRIE